MIGITACFTGRLGKDAEIRNARDGKPWASFPVAVDAKAAGEAPATWVRVALFGDAVGSPEAGATDYFDVETRNGQIILTPVRIQRADAVRAKLAELKLSEQDIAEAVTWARKGGDS